jgi:CheY-like chemotaxis protein
MTDEIKTIGKKVFLVEDDKFFVDLVAKKLSSSNFLFACAYTGEDALAAIEKENPDIILLDVILPGKMTGFDVIEQIKKNDKLKNIPVIFLSNMSNPPDIDRGMKLGAFRYLVKSSVAPSDLVEQLESMLSSNTK